MNGWLETKNTNTIEAIDRYEYPSTGIDVKEVSDTFADAKTSIGFGAKNDVWRRKPRR